MAENIGDINHDDQSVMVAEISLGSGGWAKNEFQDDVVEAHLYSDGTILLSDHNGQEGGSWICLTSDQLENLNRFVQENKTKG